MRFVNAILILFVFTLSVVPFLAPPQNDRFYTFLYDVASGKITCHCFEMQDMEELLQQNYVKGIDPAYIKDCGTDDRLSQTHISQLRILAHGINIFDPAVTLHIYIQYKYSLATIYPSLETPPPRYSA